MQPLIRDTPFGRLAAKLSLSDRSGSDPDTKEIVLVELNHFFSHHCGLPLILNGLRQQKRYRFVPYVPLQSWELSHPTLQLVLEVYKSMGIDEPPIKAELVGEHFEDAKKAVLEQFNCFNGSIWNLSNFVFDDIPLGIHLVETLLQQFRTAEFEQTTETVGYCVGLVARYLWWKNFFSTNAVSYVFGSHVCYEFALPLLAAKQINKRAYAWHHHFLMDANALLPVPHGNPALLDYSRRSWANASDSKKHLHLNECELELRLRAEGTLVPRLQNDPRFFVSNRTGEFSLNKKAGRLSVAIWSHAFTDAPNILPANEYGALCNPLVSLRKLLETLHAIECDIYVKTHPNPFPQDELALQQLLASFPGVARLPNDLTPLAVKELGFDCVITGWGTVCFEAAYIGLPVLTYTDFLGLDGLGITKKFNLADPKDILNSFELAKQMSFGDLERKMIVEQYAIYTCGVIYDVTCSEIPHLPREGEQGLYSLHSYKVWEQTFSQAKFHEALLSFKTLIQENKVALSPFNS